MTKEIIIVVLILVLIYLYYRQKNISSSPTETMYQQKIEDLENQLINLAERGFVYIGDDKVNMKELCRRYDEKLTELKKPCLKCEKLWKTEKKIQELSLVASKYTKSIERTAKLESEKMGLERIIKELRQEVNRVSSSCGNKDRAISLLEEQIKLLKNE